MKSIYQRLVSFALAHPILSPTLVGLGVRLLTAYWGMGFHARDDYFHVLDPALHWVADPNFNWDTSSLAGAGIRSHLVPRIVQGILLACHSLGLSDPSTILRVIHACLGTYSALVIPASYLLARELFKTPTGDFNATIRLAPWLMALHFAMPYGGTRLLIEALAMPCLVGGLWLCTASTWRRILLGGLLIGLACWFRYQVGAATLGLAGFLLWRGTRQESLRRGLSHVLALAAGGGLAIGLQGLFDLKTTGAFLGPLLGNIQVNLHPSEELTRSNPGAYIGFWLLLTVPPLGLVLLPPLLQASRRFGLLFWPWFSFTLLHTFIGHKEERFMLPVLPLFLLLLAPAGPLIRQMSGRISGPLKRAWPITRNALLVIHLLALALVVTNQSQSNLREAMVTLRQDEGLTTIVSLGPELQTYFLGRPSVQLQRNRKFDALWLRHTLDELGSFSSQTTAILGFSADRARIGILLMAEGLECPAPTQLKGWWLDRLIYKANPRHNLRRSPVDIWRCSHTTLAQLSPPPPIESLAQAPLAQIAR